MCWYVYVCVCDRVVYVCYEPSPLFVSPVSSDGCVVGYLWCFMFGVQFCLLYEKYIDVVLLCCLCKFCDMFLNSVYVELKYVECFVRWPYCACLWVLRWWWCCVFVFVVLLFAVLFVVVSLVLFVVEVVAVESLVPLFVVEVVGLFVVVWHAVHMSTCSCTVVLLCRCSVSVPSGLCWCCSVVMFALF